MKNEHYLSTSMQQIYMVSVCLSDFQEESLDGYLEEKFFFGIHDIPQIK